MNTQEIIFRLESLQARNLESLQVLQSLFVPAGNCYIYRNEMPALQCWYATACKLTSQKQAKSLIQIAFGKQINIDKQGFLNCTSRNTAEITWRTARNMSAEELLEKLNADIADNRKTAQAKRADKIAKLTRAELQEILLNEFNAFCKRQDEKYGHNPYYAELSQAK